MKKLLVVPVLTSVFLYTLSLGNSVHAQRSDLAAINQLLDNYHSAAAEGDWDRYFGLTSPDFVFIGTDAEERWPRQEFIDYAAGRSGWVYRPVSRNINFTPDGHTAWFDEILDSASFGTSRGTGVLIKTGTSWTLSQYHLTLPIPNELVGDVTDEIKAFEASN